jgi:hypothetical protein
VVGDLWERYRSPARFLLDAAGTVPFVIASQVRRTSTLPSVLIQIFVLSVTFATAGRGSVFAIAPVIGGTLALVLRDAYRRRISVSAKQVGVDTLYGVAGVLASQAVLAAIAPGLSLPMRAYAAILPAFGMIFLLRLQNPSMGAFPKRAMATAPASLDALMTEVRLHERMGQRARRIEACAGVLIGLFFIVPLVNGPNWFLRIGWALASAYGLYVAVVVSRYRAHPVPDGLGFRPALEHYRRELARQHGWLKTMWLWYFLPAMPGLTFVIIGSSIVAAERGRPMWPAAVVAAIVFGVGIIGHIGTRKMARQLQIRIDALGAAAGE